MNATYKYDGDDTTEQSVSSRRFTALGIIDVQGDPMLAVVVVEGNKLISTNVVHPSSSFMSECKSTLLGLLKQVLK